MSKNNFDLTRKYANKYINDGNLINVNINSVRETLKSCVRKPKENELQDIVNMIVEVI